jgi:N-acyl-D-amino-acid deacylase
MHARAAPKNAEDLIRREDAKTRHQPDAFAQKPGKTGHRLVSCPGFFWKTGHDRTSSVGHSVASRFFARFAGLLLFCAAAAGTAAEPNEFILRNARIVDGTGNPTIHGDVLVRDGRIIEVGRVPEHSASEIDLHNQVLAPGFIDVHTHTENIVSLPGAENFIRMGVTTVVTGNCGSSALDVAKFFREVEDKHPAVNVATLYGHNTIRRKAMGGSFDRDPTPEELDRMRALVDQAMKDGAVGFSTGLIYLPGTFSKTPEIVELAKVAARYDGIYTSHMRSEGTGIFKALDEVFQVAREAHIRAEVSHIKLGGNAAWGKSAEVLAAIEKARAEGLDVTQDQYMYTASSTGLDTMIPSQALEGGAAAFKARIADPEQKAKIVAEMKDTLRKAGRTGYGHAVIASFPGDRSLNGKTIPEAAKILRGSDSLDDQIETILDLEARGGGSGIFHGMNEDDLQAFLRHPNTMIASDSGVREMDESVPHPRGYGNNARVLARYVRELKVLRLEDAVRRMTSLPATTFHFKDRGVIREGAIADLVAFDPDTVQDDATYADPHHYARGFSYVWVNGKAVIKDNQPTGERPGEALRHRPR